MTCKCYFLFIFQSGEGLYFSFELQVSQLFSQSVLSWNRSKLGELISCTAVCEYIDDPLYTKIRKGMKHKYINVQEEKCLEKEKRSF